MILTVVFEGLSKAGTELSVMLKVYTIPHHDRGYLYVVLVLQSCRYSLHILPSLSTETNALSGGVCNFSNTDDEEDVVVIEEMLIFINKEVDRGIKQEYVKSETDEVSYVCICLYRKLDHHYTH